MTIVRLSHLPRNHHQTFMQVTLQRYRAMVARFAERRDKRDRVYRYERQIPFTLDQFREWMLAKLNGSEAGTTQCPYCGAWLTAADCAIDHRHPVARGGSLELDNLQLLCASCNQKKGKLMHEYFLLLLRTLDGFPEADKRDVLQRLESAYQLAAQRNWHSKKRAKAAITNEVTA
jgi:5-methylcytosine-specific restriction endonuclease McrA